MPVNVSAEWKIERFEVAGFGRASYGTSPYGGRAQAWHVGSAPYSAVTAAINLNCSATWSVDSQAAGSWVAV